MATLNTQYGSVYSLVVTPRFLICGTYNQNIQIYAIAAPGDGPSVAAEHTHVQALTGHIGTVTYLQLSSSGKYLISASRDTTVEIWNLDNFLCVQTLMRHEDEVHAVVLRSGRLYSGSADGTIKIFKASTLA